MIAGLLFSSGLFGKYRSWFVILINCWLYGLQIAILWIEVNIVAEDVQFQRLKHKTFHEQYVPSNLAVFIREFTVHRKRWLHRQIQ